LVFIKQTEKENRKATVKKKDKRAESSLDSTPAQLGQPTFGPSEAARGPPLSLSLSR
jgi:hypothetical protein